MDTLIELDPSDPGARLLRVLVINQCRFHEPAQSDRAKAAR